MHKSVELPAPESLKDYMTDDAPEEPQPYEVVLQEAIKSIFDSILTSGVSMLEHEVDTAMTQAMNWAEEKRAWEAHTAKKKSAKKPTKKVKITVKKVAKKTTVKKTVKKSKKK